MQQLWAAHCVTVSAAASTDIVRANNQHGQFSHNLCFIMKLNLQMNSITIEWKLWTNSGELHRGPSRVGWVRARRLRQGIKCHICRKSWLRASRTWWSSFFFLHAIPIRCWLHSLHRLILNLSIFIIYDCFTIHDLGVVRIGPSTDLQLLVMFCHFCK